MYKPHTIEQYKIQRFLDETFAMEHFIVSPLSRTSLLLEDETGEQLAFGFWMTKCVRFRSRRQPPGRNQRFHPAFPGPQSQTASAYL